MEPLRIEFTVACSRERAFEVWTSEISHWWPKGHSFSADPGLTVVLEPGVGGRIFERTSEGEEHDWGEVTTWEPPHRLAYLWHLRFDRADATDVEITFAGEGEETKVTIVHGGWERLGAVAAERRERNQRGWAGLLSHYQDAVV